MRKHFHLIGINGIGVSGVARILLEMGHQVSGSDPQSSELTDRLTQMGAVIYHEHREENVAGADYIVVSSAIPWDNPEIKRAKEKGIPILHRAQVLGYIMKERIGIAVTGTHGKTTTSSMMSMMLEMNHVDPTIVVGGQLNGIMSNAKLGKSPYMVVEADESDASFLHLTPRWIVVTSVDVDVNLNVAPYSHLNFDYEKTLEKVTEAFYEFLKTIPENGKAVLCIDDENIRSMIPNISKPMVTYGFSTDADIRAEEIRLKNFGSSSRVIYKGQYLGDLILRVPGDHNIKNALSVIVIGMEMGLTFNEIVKALYKFTGVKRRFQLLGEVNNILVVDDYAHNPGKVQALLQGAKTGGRNRVILVFQPHRYTRTKFLFNEFAQSFYNADTLILTDLYSAGECPIVGVKSEFLAEAVRKSGKSPTEVYFIPGKDEVVSFLENYSRYGDLIITCGAGDIYKTGEQLVQQLSYRESGKLLAVG